MKEEPKKEDSDDQENSDIDVDHHEVPEDPASTEDDTVIDLSSSGSCSWCHKHGPCALEDSGGTSSSGGLNGNSNHGGLSCGGLSGGRKLRKRFCSERCFGLHRRAMFKKSKRCEWCHTGLNEADNTASITFCGLNFCR